ncbi:MAG: adenosine-specific kinase [Candidatus Omnitrophica bacterium]|nr:adenosine-specific kinase [Candidatus Omnitrophota bacterium]
MELRFEVVKVEKPEELNIIIGQAHFIKTVEDLYEALIEVSPVIKFGIAFCEASGKCLVRTEGNDQELKSIAVKNALKIGCGHMFFIILKDAYPLNVLNRIKQLSEVCAVFCAGANEVEVVVAVTGQGRAFLGAVDGFSPNGIEDDSEVKWRKGFLRKIGYKLGE